MEDSLALTEAQQRRRSYAAAYYPSPMADAGVPSPPPPSGTTADTGVPSPPPPPGTTADTGVPSPPPPPGATAGTGVPSPSSPPGTTADTARETISMSPGINSSAATADTARETISMSPGFNSSAAAADTARETISMSPGINSSAAAAAESSPPVPPCLDHPGPVEAGEMEGTAMPPSQPQQGVITGGGGTRGNQWHRNPFNVRGRGRKNLGGGRGFRGGGSGFNYPAPTGTLSSPPVQVVESPVQEVAPATMATLAAQVKVRLWCDTCRVECYSMENLEMHKNGRRHKKTLVKLEKYEAQQKLESGLQEPTAQIAHDEAKTDTPMVTLTEAKTDTPMVTLTEAATPVEVPPQAPTIETRNGRDRPNGKRKKSSASGPTRVCTLCNAYCATNAIFEVHLGSKKHTARIKRLKGPEHVYGPVAAPIVADVESLFFGLACRDTVEQQGNGIDAGTSAHEQAGDSGQVEDGALEPQAKQEVEC